MSSVSFDPDHDDRRAVRNAVGLLLDLNAPGCKLLLRIAEVADDYHRWDPDEGEQFNAFRALVEVLLDNVEILDEMLPLIKARAEERQAYEAQAARDAAAAKQRVRRYNQRRSPPVVRLVQKDDDTDPAS